jgi:hypothetical protein
MKPVLRHIPDIRPPDAPTVHRFGDPRDLAAALGDQVLVAARSAGPSVPPRPSI